MVFTTQIQGIPCQCDVLRYIPAKPMCIYDMRYGDADPPEAAEFEFIILDRKGYRATWLENKINQEDINRLQEEFEAAYFAEKYGKEF